MFDLDLTDILDSEICDDQYVLYRSDCNIELTGKTRGGGVLIAVIAGYYLNALKLKFQVWPIT
ncbi:uncharacterized protein LOC123309905 [Coccinella septempunctata]|uniref:uncharacterized protein LOC123309905 n=1 Tax=Coccinella septempunctata TaxID=41139 RepID=UPI001D099054|nr:uncharacterized protein LOC123309905 [Coccinella septempunctata]